jgi:acetolactate synthase I/II/III large subunit
MKMTGAQALWESLEREGVEVVFGIPGGTVIHLFDALARSRIRHVLTRHEQGAAHAADGYARVTGKIGVCIATSGPGATNLVTGLATAYMDSSPVLAITGQVATPFIGTDYFQEVDITGITLPITKHNYLVTDIAELPMVIKEAVAIATSGRPGPVLIDVAKDVQAATLDYEYPETVQLPRQCLPPRVSAAAIEKAAAMINEAERPLIIAGHGVIIANVEDALLELATKANIPVATTLLGIGAFPETHALSLRMLGMHGEVYTNKTLTMADLVISLGSRFDDRITGPISHFAREAKILHFDVDAAEVGKVVHTHHAVIGDLRDSLPALLPMVEGKSRAKWLDRIELWRTDSHSRDILAQETDDLVPQYVVRQLWHATKGETLVVSDVGQNQMWEAQYFIHHRRKALLSSGGLGTMGFSLPAAIGAQIACPDQQVWALSGDGGFQMNIQELATVVQEKLPIKMAILNNGCLGMVRQWQQLFFDACYSGTIVKSPDFAKIAEAYGIRGRKIEQKADVVPAIDEALAHDGPVVLDFRVLQDELVYPMVAPGSPMTDMIRRPASNGGEEL